MSIAAEYLSVCGAGRGIEQLSRGGVGTVVLSLICSVGCGGGMDGLPGDFSGFFSRLFEVAVVPPKGGSVFTAMYKDTARPGCADA